MRDRICTLLLALASAPATAATFTVTRPDDPSPAPACAPGDCTLRAAILAVNGNSGSDTIAFNVPVANPGDVVTFSPGTPLPALTDAGTTIDGLTQPGTVLGGANNIRFNPQLKIHIRGGDGDDTLGAGLLLEGGGATIQGVSISHFDGAQIEIRSSNNVIAGNLLGVSPLLEYDFPRSSWGIFVGSPMVPGDIVNNLIGTSALPNLIAGSLTGIELSGVGAGDTAALENRVQANFIGIAPDGEGALPMQDGVIVRDSANIRIGQNRPPNFTRGNYIGGFGSEFSRGIFILDSNAVAVDGNCIGGISGAQIVAHPVGTGILVGAGSSDVVMEFNLLLATRGSGIELAYGTPNPSGVLITNNRMFATGGLPIDLGGDGPTPNDPFDTDIGPNGLANAPTLTLEDQGTDLRATIALQALAGREYFTDIMSRVCEEVAQEMALLPFADGMDFVFDDPPPAMTDANGNATFQSTFPRTVLPRNHCPTAVAIDSAGNTSEVSAPAAVPGAAVMCTISFERAFDIVTFAHHSSEYTVNVLRDGALDQTCSARLRSSTPNGGLTIPSIASGGNLMTWGPNDVTPRPVTLNFSGGALVVGDAWTLTLSAENNANVAPHRSFQLARSFNQEAFTDILFGGPGGSFEAPRLQ